ncbi:hypothetical protein SETIT_2G064200v2 [Setaria italica]|uniref:F-box domain-containing protein n=1 Tax=Setaria italica TaxID=4555 RepID=K4A0V4_SETIT|nr:uncharacterized protein LOC111256452 [Setaria italica]RCV09870.1 hypothetical protein SETIT_2G064200v2 [Setaria italica]
MALQATEQGSRPPASDADTDPARRPLGPGGMGGSKRAAVAGLPDDALVEILSRLPAKFLCRSKCVSKAWCDLIADRLRCRKLPLTLEGFFYGCVYESCNEDRDDLSSDSWDESGSEGNDDDGSEDDKEGGSANNGKGGSEDGDEGGECKGEKSSCHACGHFINLLGRSVPLVDPSFSVLRKQPGIKNFTLLDSCNGLLLFGQAWCSRFSATTSYIVYNPATEHWVPVPSSGFSSNPLEYGEDCDDDVEESCVLTCLIFDPAISSHFQLIEFCHNPGVALVLAYSSETERWGDRPRERRRWKKGGKWDLHKTMSSMRGSTFFNKMLHLIVSPYSIGPELIAAIDGKGKTRKVIQWVENRGFPVFVGQSKGLLHCLSVSGHPDGDSCHMTELSIWVLEDYDAEEWNLKHTVSFLELFGKKSCQFGSDYNVTTIHPDQNLVFFIQHWDYKLISYDMDRKEVCALRTVGCDYGIITPYAPYFSETPVLSKKH